LQGHCFQGANNNSSDGRIVNIATIAFVQRAFEHCWTIAFRVQTILFISNGDKNNGANLADLPSVGWLLIRVFRQFGIRIGGAFSFSTSRD
jgi:hypothetical protein